MNVDTSTRGLAYLTDAAGCLPNASVILHAAKECNDKIEKKMVRSRLKAAMKFGMDARPKKNGNKSIATLLKV